MWKHTIADQRVPSNDPRHTCGTNFGSSSSSFLKWRIEAHCELYSMNFWNCSAWQLFPSLSLLFVTLSYDSSWTYKHGLVRDWGGGGVDAIPSQVFLVLFLDDQVSTTDVFFSCLFILRTYFDTRLVMISFYGYEIWRQTIFEWKCVFFQFFSMTKVKRLGKMKQSTY